MGAVNGHKKCSRAILEGMKWDLGVLIHIPRKGLFTRSWFPKDLMLIGIIPLVQRSAHRGQGSRDTLLFQVWPAGSSTA